MAIVRRHNNKQIAAVSVQTRIDTWRKQASIAARAAQTEYDRCVAAMRLIKDLTGLVERMNHMDALTLAAVFRACDRAWREFAVQCGAVIEGYKPTTKWFREIVVQLAYKHTEYVDLDVQVFELGWGAAIDLLDPEIADDEALFEVA